MLNSIRIKYLSRGNCPTINVTNYLLFVKNKNKTQPLLERSSGFRRLEARKELITIRVIDPALAQDAVEEPKRRIHRKTHQVKESFGIVGKVSSRKWHVSNY